MDERGKPIGGVKVFAGNDILGDFDHPLRTTTPDGRFAFDNLPAHDVAVTRFEFAHPDYSENHHRELPLDAETPVEVILQDKGQIRGIVLSARTGMPVPSFPVRIDFTPIHEPGDTANVLPVTKLVDPGLKMQAADGRATWPAATRPG